MSCGCKNLVSTAGSWVFWGANGQVNVHPTRGRSINYLIIYFPLESCSRWSSGEDGVSPCFLRRSYGLPCPPSWVLLQLSCSGCHKARVWDPSAYTVQDRITGMSPGLRRVWDFTHLFGILCWLSWTAMLNERPIFSAPISLVRAGLPDLCTFHRPGVWYHCPHVFLWTWVMVLVSLTVQDWFRSMSNTWF